MIEMCKVEILIGSVAPSDALFLQGSEATKAWEVDHISG